MSNKSTIDRASEYVQANARYLGPQSKRPYTVRWPPTASMSMFSDDTWDLVKQVARKMEKLEKVELP